MYNASSNYWIDEKVWGKQFESVIWVLENLYTGSFALRLAVLALPLEYAQFDTVREVGKDSLRDLPVDPIDEVLRQSHRHFLPSRHSITNRLRGFHSGTFFAPGMPSVIRRISLYVT